MVKEEIEDDNNDWRAVSRKVSATCCCRHLNDQMNITLTITTNHDLHIPSEASGKCKASDNNSQNPNTTPKAKHKRKEMSSSYLSVFSQLSKCCTESHPTGGSICHYLSSSVVLSC